MCTKYRIKSILMATALTAVVSSCNNFLETEPSDFVAPETYYSNAEEVFAALTGVYNTIHLETVYGSNYSCMISGVDDLSYYDRTNISGEVYVNDQTPGNTILLNTWTSLYAGINNANLLLEKIDGADMDENLRTKYKGEARFLRAYYHFILAQAWGDIPVKTASTNDVASVNTPKKTQAEVFDFIINEMEACADMVDSTEYNLSVSRVKKTAVEGILARVCLTRAGYPSNGGKPYYEKAAHWANEVKKSGKHNLNPDVYAMYKNMASDKVDGIYNESIWEAEFLGNRTEGHYSAGRLGNVNGILNNADPNIAQGDGYGYGFFSGTTILWDLYLKTQNGTTPDARRDLSMAPYTYAKGVKSNWSATNIVQRNCGKFRREWEVLFPKEKNYTPENFPIIRYADVLLMLAESENEVNQAPTALAYECINKVRERAGVLPLSGLSYDQFKQELKDERGRELCFEGIRKYDLVRWGEYVTAVHDRLGAAVADTKRWQTAKGFAAFYAARTEKKHEFLPIPTKELGLNKALVQNPLW